ncbi:hypothetical protein HB662_16590 [Roseomonas frigidaquae]|uniref:Uncharacterized protein n=1 Tax=Falsiroseomonas frigidaquae TaxID=487318 RepID=A0ABX1F277_9PROT|nr:hypothetical protein [Falsiroseomonas frigidaquae]NKE46402.1 hypothetical protein [Falsiroseomonas frigidaquae]
MIPEIPPQLMAALADAPLAALMLWMMHMLRRELQARPEAPPVAPTVAPPVAFPVPHPGPSRDELVDFKLEVARTYVPLSLIRDLDSRLSLQLLRIEEKLDEVSRTATTATAIAGQAMPNCKMGFGARADAESSR